MSFLRGQPTCCPRAPVDPRRAAFVALGAMLHRSPVRAGLHESAGRGLKRFVRGELWRRTVGTLLRSSRWPSASSVIKDIKLFFRDTTQLEPAHLLAGARVV